MSSSKSSERPSLKVDTQRNFLIPKYESASGSKSVGGNVSNKKNVNRKLYKTNLCRTFSKVGSCPYGKKCQFAHGEEDLRPLPDEEDPESLEGASYSYSKSANATPVSILSVAALNAGMNSPTLGVPAGKISLETPSSSKVLNMSSASPRVAKLSLSKLLLETEALSPRSSKSSPQKWSDIVVSPVNADDVSEFEFDDENEDNNNNESVNDLDQYQGEIDSETGELIECDPKVYKTELCRSFSRTGECRYGKKCQFAHGLEDLRAAPTTILSPRIRSKSPSFGAADEMEPVLSFSPAKFSLTSLNIVDDEDEYHSRVSTPRLSARSPHSVSSTPGKMYVKDVRVYKTELCKKFEATGECPYGVKCQFAHGMAELRMKSPSGLGEDFDFVEVSPLSFTDETMDDEDDQLSTPKHDPRLYKTELCRSFNKAGYCRYGLKCQFAHGIQELRPSPKVEVAESLSGIGSPRINIKSLSLNIGEKESLNVFNDSPLELSPKRKNLLGSPVIGPSKKAFFDAEGDEAVNGDGNGSVVSELFNISPKNAALSMKTE